MAQFVATAQAATAGGVGRVLRTERGIDAMALAPDYPLAKWRNDREVDIEVRRYLLTLVAKAPYLADIDDPGVRDKVLSCEFSFKGEEASGIGMAFVLRGLSLSIPSSGDWDYPLLDLHVKELDEATQTFEFDSTVVHASSPAHVAQHGTWIVTRLKESVSSGAELMARRSDLFPSLSFCGSAVGSIEDLSQGHPQLPSVIKRLFELQAYCSTWTEGPFRPGSLATKATPESASTLEQFGEERTFECPDGERRVFSWHLRLTLDGWRLHFIPEAGPCRMIIGRIGPHLRTAKFRN